MKKSILAFSLLFAIIGFTSCKKNTPKKTPIVSSIAIDANKTEVNWTAYKTTDKVPVKGKFTLINIASNPKATSKIEALNGTEFSIPVSSLFTNNPDRDNKLKTLFFGVMKNTELLTGSLAIENDSVAYANLKMNDVVEKLPLSLVSDGTKISLTGTMDTNSWNAEDAINSINKACFELHKGADGISKTWSDVAISIDVYFK